MEFKDEKRRFVHNLIAEGLKMDEAKSNRGLNGVAAPEYLVEKWAKKFYAPAAKMGFPEAPRLVNRFMLGADPEFVLYDYRAEAYNAESMGLDTLSAFGCDMCGRLAELRAYPSRFALDVVASLVDTLRWMLWAHPNTFNCQWKAVPFFGRDGCGGHIHFGRKRPNREEEIKALDRITGLLTSSGVFDLRLMNDRRNQTEYGRNHDFRPQSHGYEYRTMPTWLGSPWQAYFTIVVSKLAVMHQFEPSTNSPGRQLVNLIRAYRGVDDDASICARVIERIGLPVASSEDFKKAWGLSLPVGYEILKDHYREHYFPTIIEPSLETRKELFDYFIDGVELPMRVPKPNWKPFKLDGQLAKVNIRPHNMGIPEVAQGLISYKTSAHLDGQEALDRITIHSSWNLNQSAIAAKLKPMIPDITVRFVASPPIGKDCQSLYISLPGNLRGNVALQTSIRLLLSDTELFPITKASKLDSTDFSKWDAVQVKPVATPIQMMGYQVAQVQQQQQQQEAQFFVPQERAGQRALVGNARFIYDDNF